MGTRSRLLVATVVVAGLTAGVAGAVGSEKVALLGPQGNRYCQGYLFAGTEGGYGFAIINYEAETDTVSATVSLKGLAPNALYDVRLIQGNADCYVNDGKIETNEQGNGTIHLSEPSYRATAFVFVTNVTLADYYVTEVYSH